MIVELPVHATSVAQCNQMGLDTTSLKLRLIRIENDGKIAVLITSLIDTEQYPIEIFKGVMALLFHDTVRKIRRLIADLQYIFQRTVEPIRPGRKYPRNHKAKPRKFFPQDKPIG